MQAPQPEEEMTHKQIMHVDESKGVLGERHILLPVDDSDVRLTNYTLVAYYVTILSDFLNLNTPSCCAVFSPITCVFVFVSNPGL